MNIPPIHDQKKSLLDHIIWWCLNNRLIITIFLVFAVGWGLMVAPFDWEIGGTAP